MLLGVRLTNPDSAESYRTYWIARENGGVSVVASGPDLLVPTRSGFWRVCVIGGHSSSDEEFAQWDSVVSGPALRSRGRCTQRGKPATDEEQQGARCYRTTELELLFVGSDALSSEVHEETNCGAHYSGGAIAILSSLNGKDSLDYAAFVEPARKRALMPATLESARTEFSDFGVVDSVETAPDSDEGGAHLVLQRQWAIERGEGRWQTAGLAYCWPYTACGDGVRRFSVPNFRAPKALVGHDDLSPSLEAIRVTVPKARDAVSSPRNDLVVAVAADSIVVFSINNGKLGAPVLSIPVAGRIVMAQWAVGRFVPIWTSKLKTLLH